MLDKIGGVDLFLGIGSRQNELIVSGNKRGLLRDNSRLLFGYAQTIQLWRQILAQIIAKHANNGDTHF